jgi:hypothetical protein
VIQDEPAKILKYKDLTRDIQCMWNVKNKTDTSNNKGNRNHFIIIQKVTEQHTGKAGDQGTKTQTY